MQRNGIGGRVRHGHIVGQWRLVGDNVELSVHPGNVDAEPMKRRLVTAVPKALNRYACEQQRLMRSTVKAQTPEARKMFQAAAVAQEMALTASGYLQSQRGHRQRSEQELASRVRSNRKAVRSRREALTAG
jgi:hypothetical protein